MYILLLLLLPRCNCLYDPTTELLAVILVIVETFVSPRFTVYSCLNMIYLTATTESRAATARMSAHETT